ncbi:hypothetical protein PFISCL1PPCAC_9122, partial [Pristionchus fissidentatus]
SRPMAEAEVLDAAVAQDEQPQQAAWFSFGGLFRMFITFQIMSSVVKFMGGGGAGSAANSTAADNLFTPGMRFDLYAHLSHSDVKEIALEDAPFWIRKDLSYDWAIDEAMYSESIPTPAPLLANQSMHLHVFIVKSGLSINPKDKNYAKATMIHGTKQLNRYMKRRYSKTTNLLTGETSKSEEEQRKAEEMTHEMLNFWHPNLTISLIVDQTKFTRGQLPEPLASAVKFGKGGRKYTPILFLNSYWNLVEDYQAVNETVKEVNLTLTYSPMSLFKYQLYASQEMQKQWTAGLGLSADDDDSGRDQDAVKRALVETNPYLLAITVVVSLLHTVFEFLAFKNDIQFWKSKDNFEGLSVRTVLWGIGQHVVVFLYVCDNDTNFMIKASLFVGILIECWKVPKCFNIEVDRSSPILGLIPRVKFNPSNTTSQTSEYDMLAFRYLRWVMYPALLGYAAYSLVYEEQKGWYSWILSTLYGYLLMFGFVMMTPQLFINYKLKSVAHLPWRMLTYKFINTFIDDLFAFVIKMPTLYRIGCFRDDIIFLVYLYQKWAYRVDHTRVNEYGVSGEEMQKVEERKEGGEEDGEKEEEKGKDEEKKEKEEHVEAPPKSSAKKSKIAVLKRRTPTAN